ncbi:hypothetical protein AMCSP08_001910 [Streptococcus pneumoniae 2072047]|nr:hypothetical protein AMCSP08_001910 [Streptococcus pneumoniae 2072047]
MHDKTTIDLFLAFSNILAKKKRSLHKITRLSCGMSIRLRT